MRKYPVLIDFLLTIIIALIWSRPWQDVGLTNDQWTHLKTFDERDLAANALQNEALAAMTVVSIIFVAIGAVLGQGAQLDADAKAHLKASALLCLISLVVGVWILGSLPVQVNFYNVAYDGWLALFCVCQRWLTLFAAWRVLHGMNRLLT